MKYIFKRNQINDKNNIKYFGILVNDVNNITKNLIYTFESIVIFVRLIIYLFVLTCKTPFFYHITIRNFHLISIDINISIFQYYLDIVEHVENV